MAVGEPVLNIVNRTMLDAGLTKIADAIRTKGGTSAQLAFPDGMADAIAAIQSGGGGNIAYGTYTPASDAYRIYYADVNAQRPKLAFIVGDRAGSDDYLSIFINSQFASPANISLVKCGTISVMYNIAGIDDTYLGCTAKMFRAGTTYTYLLAW